MERNTGHQQYANGRNTAISSLACALADSDLPGRLRVAVSVGKAGCENSGDDPRIGASQNNETPSLDPSALDSSPPRKTKRTPIKQ